VASQRHVGSKRNRGSRWGPRWWRSLKPQDRIALTGVLVALLAAVPSYLLIFRAEDNSRSSMPSPTTTVSGVLGAPGDGGSRSAGHAALKVMAEYNWTTASIIWALPGQLGPEDEEVVEQPWDDANVDYPSQIEAVLAKRDGVKVTFDSTEDNRKHSQLRLIVIGQTDAPVLISGIRAHISKRAPPLSGTLIYLEPQGEGSNIQIGFDLDSPNPVARTFDQNMDMKEAYFANRHVSVKKGEQVVFAIRAYTSRCYCEWELLVDVVVDGKKETLTVKDGKKSFRTTALTDSYRTIYEIHPSGVWRFEKQPPGTKFE
jgi:hypothetical protein